MHAFPEVQFRIQPRFIVCYVHLLYCIIRPCTMLRIIIRLRSTHKCRYPHAPVSRVTSLFTLWCLRGPVTLRKGIFASLTCLWNEKIYLPWHMFCMHVALALNESDNSIFFPFYLYSWSSATIIKIFCACSRPKNYLICWLRSKRVRRFAS